jgi:hypothetical protein
MLVTDDRVARICAGQPGGVSIDPGHCRPVACGCSGDCPDDGVCRNGLCQRLVEPLGLDDVASLCAAALPWPSACEDQFNESWARFFDLVHKATATCKPDGNCAVPASCRKP